MVASPIYSLALSFSAVFLHGSHLCVSVSQMPHTYCEKARTITVYSMEDINQTPYLYHLFESSPALQSSEKSEVWNLHVPSPQVPCWAVQKWDASRVGLTPSPSSTTSQGHRLYDASVTFHPKISDFLRFYPRHLKVKISTFHSSASPQDFLSWLIG